MEMLPVNTTECYQLYPGGHIISYDLASGKFEDLIRIKSHNAVSVIDK